MRSPLGNAPKTPLNSNVTLPSIIAQNDRKDLLPSPLAVEFSRHRPFSSKLPILGLGAPALKSTGVTLF
ncbi:MAG: hypothetical protein KME26_00735 [Oscillatoria princeps RMCB-10]|nr:hypothetical protein [Oscillatoria princeps RMCB-10]